MEIQEIEKLFSQGKDDDKVRTVLNLEQESRNFETDQLLHEAGEITDIYTGLPPHYISDEVRLRFAEIKKGGTRYLMKEWQSRNCFNPYPLHPLKKENRTRKRKRRNGKRLRI
jgi:hypothetical protein